MTTTRRWFAWRRVTWPYPEWWAICLCVAAWMAMVLMSDSKTVGMHAAHAHSHHMVATAALPEERWTVDTFWWLVMILAMMLPLVLESIRTTAARSLWRRRHRAITGFLVGYVGLWMVFGVAATLTVSSLKLETWAWAAAAGFAVALLWQLTPLKRRSTFTCHRTMPLAPTGWRADRDCLRYGWAIGSSCLISCWALMLACLLTRHSIPAMLGITAVGWIERNQRRPNRILLCALIAILGLIYAIAPHL